MKNKSVLLTILMLCLTLHCSGRSFGFSAIDSTGRPLAPIGYVNLTYAEARKSLEIAAKYEACTEQNTIAEAKIEEMILENKALKRRMFWQSIKQTAILAGLIMIIK